MATKTTKTINDVKTPKKALKTPKKGQKSPKNAKTQAIKGAGKGGIVPPKERRFGQPNGNKQGRGFWKKEDTPRWKLEQMMKLTDTELFEVANNSDAPLFERKLAQCLKDGKWKEIQEMINQVYGFPMQAVETRDLTPPPPLSPRKAKEKK